MTGAISNAFLADVERLADWIRIESALGTLYAHTGRPSYPPLVLFKMLLLEQWYGLSDPQCEDACRDRLSFRRFLGLSLTDAVPDETVLVRFRQRLADAGLMQRLLDWLNEQFEARGLIVKRGTLIDATVVKSARTAPPKQEGARDTSDPEATWQAMKDRPVHGFKVHIAADEAHTLVRAVSVTPAHVHDSVPANGLIQQDEQAVDADKAYDSRARADFLESLDIDNRILRRGRRNRPLSEADRAHNRRHSAIRAGIERVPGWFKAKNRMPRCRYLGVIANQVHAHVLAMAYNLRRAVNLMPPPLAATG
ncbi:IS5 family transposase [Fontimonas sp. SYSU GA230001]|uniref:IS5 family transposase n=1 Tax=Fontimonas sp. SYSU GA230001 TaxID=3142450 RepID=UPI0032B31570